MEVIQLHNGNSRIKCFWSLTHNRAQKSEQPAFAASILAILLLICLSFELNEVQY